MPVPAFSYIFAYLLIGPGKKRNASWVFFLLLSVILLFLDLQSATEPAAAAESLAEVPEHVLRGLPEEVRLFPSAVDKTRIGEYWGHRGDRGGEGGTAGCIWASFGCLRRELTVEATDLHSELEDCVVFMQFPVRNPGRTQIMKLH